MIKAAVLIGAIALVSPAIASAQINSPVPSNAYITYDGLEWAWGGPCPYSGGCYATGDLSYQSTQGWSLPSQADMAIVDAEDSVNPGTFASLFLGNGGNVPAGGGTDPVSGAYFTGSVGQASGGSCATPYFSGQATWCDDADGLNGDWAGSVIGAGNTYDEQLYVRQSVSGAPEPSSWALLFASIGGAGLMLRRARNTIRLARKGAVEA